MPDAKDLPRPVAPLVKRNGIAIVDADWSRSMQLLFEKLQDLSRTARAAVKRRVATTRRNTGRLDTLQTRYFDELNADPNAAAATARKALGLLDARCPTTRTTRRCNSSADSS